MRSNINKVNQNPEIDIYSFVDIIIKNKILLFFFMVIFIVIGWFFNSLPIPTEKKVTIIISELEEEQETEIQMLNLELNQLLLHNDESEFYKFSSSETPSRNEINLSREDALRLTQHVTTDFLFEQLNQKIIRKEVITPMVFEFINNQNETDHTYTYEEIFKFFDSIMFTRRTEPISDNKTKTILEARYLSGSDYNEILKKNYIYESAIKIATISVKKNLNRKIDSIVRSVNRKIDFQIQTLEEYNDILLLKISNSENDLRTNLKSSLIEFYNKVVENNPEVVLSPENNEFAFFPEIKLSQEIDKYYETILLIEKMKNKSSLKNFNKFIESSTYLKDNFFAVNYSPYDFTVKDEFNRQNGLYRLPVSPLIFFSIIGFFISLFFIFFIDGYRKYSRLKKDA